MEENNLRNYCKIFKKLYDKKIAIERIGGHRLRFGFGRFGSISLDFF